MLDGSTKEPDSPVKLTKAKRRRMRFIQLANAAAEGRKLVGGTSSEVLATMHQMQQQLVCMQSRLEAVEGSHIATCFWIPDACEQWQDWNPASWTQQAANGEDAGDSLRSEGVAASVNCDVPRAAQREVSQEEVAARAEQAIAAAIARSRHCKLCSTDLKDANDTCWCFELFCGACDRIALHCECDEPILLTKTCIECGKTEGVVSPKLQNLTVAGHVYSAAREVEGDTVDADCQSCGGAMFQNYNWVDWRDICGECNSVKDQQAIEPCCSKDCLDEHGMFHTYCMQDVGGGHQCKQCYTVGQPAEISEEQEEAEEDDEESDSDVEFKSVDSFAGLQVGMQLGAGEVAEIFPGLDKFTVQHKMSWGGVEIRHHSISKNARKMLGKQAAATTKCQRMSLDALD